MMTPYTTAKTSTGGAVRIGSNCQRVQRWSPTRTEALLQTALIDPRTAAPMNLFQRFLGAIWRWA